MLTGRRCLSAVTLDSQIYAIGGCFGDEEALCLSTVESFDVNEQRWQALPDMKTARYSCGAALLGNRIYVVGGFGYDSSNNETVPLAECEYFDTEAQTWHTVSSLQCGRGALSVVAVDGRLYAIGGFNGRYLSSVERYDPLTDSWTYCESLQQPRSGCGIAHINVDANELFIKSQHL
jgi:N-acetylneuraminic acid mutarotase